MKLPKRTSCLTLWLVNWRQLRTMPTKNHKNSWKFHLFTRVFASREHLSIIRLLKMSWESWRDWSMSMNSRERASMREKLSKSTIASFTNMSLRLKKTSDYWKKSRNTRYSLAMNREKGWFLAKRYRCSRTILPFTKENSRREKRSTKWFSNKRLESRKKHSFPKR